MQEGGLHTSSAHIVKAAASTAVLGQLNKFEQDLRPANVENTQSDSEAKAPVQDIVKPLFFQHTEQLAEFGTTNCGSPECKLILEGKLLVASIPWKPQTHKHLVRPSEVEACVLQRGKEYELPSQFCDATQHSNTAGI